MTETILSQQDRLHLLQIARQALEKSVLDQLIPQINISKLSPPLSALGASFVTLLKSGRLRGCIGSLEPTRPLAIDVQNRTVAAASNDYRFPVVIPEELSAIKIEISRLSQPQPIDYTDPEELCTQLRPGIDGVVLHEGSQRATFLPQVWSNLPLPKDFLGELCQKMGADRNLWRHKMLEIEIYQVEEIHE